MKKYSSLEISKMALSDETNIPVERHNVDRWWKRNIWDKMQSKEKREWAQELIRIMVSDSILSNCSKQLLGRAVTEICNFFNSIY